MQLYLLDEKFEHVDVGDIGDVCAHTIVEVKERVQIFHRKVIVRLPKSSALWLKNDGVEWLNLPMVVHLQSVELCVYDPFFLGLHGR